MVEMNNAPNGFKEFLDNYLDALQGHALGAEILNGDAVPTDMSTPDAMEFLEDNLAKTSVLAKKQQYNSMVQVYFDVKMAVTALLVQQPMGSDRYKQVNDFFKFSVDLLNREAERLRLQSGQQIKHENEQNSAEPNFETEVVNDMYQVCTDYNQWNGQAYFIIGQTGPLFSSLNGKAPIDPRPTEVHGLFDTTSVVQLKERDHAHHLGSQSQRVLNQIPHPALPPTEIMTGFTHPIKSALRSSKWLKRDGFSSYAPSKDNSGVIVDDQEASNVWFEYFGHTKLTTEQEVKDAAIKRIQQLEEALNGDPMDIDKDDLLKPNEEFAEKKEKEPQSQTATPQKLAGSENTTSTSTTVEEEDGKIDLVDIFSWRPGNFIDNDEIEAAHNGTESELASKLLLQLQQIQRLRLAHTDKTEFEISALERRLSFKIQRVLARLVGDTTPEKLGLETQTYMPVLQTVYNGSLPAPEVKSQPQMTRLGGSRNTPRTYNKRR